MPKSTAPLRLGILGCANIARQFVRDVKGCASVDIVAVASRDAAKANAFGEAFGIATRHASYEALLADPGVDAIYNPLPNTLHAQWCIRASERGKHVLCEKPLATSLADAQAIFAAAEAHGTFTLESYPWWFQPQTAAMMALVGGASGIGPIRSVQAAFGFTLANPDGNIRMDPALGGGALLDAGSYALSLIQLVMGRAPDRVEAQADLAATGVDISTVATLRYAGGARAQMSCAMNAAGHRHALIVGANGVIDTDFLNHTGDGGAAAHGYFPSRMRVRDIPAATRALEDVAAPQGSGFRFAAEAFAKMIASHDQAEVDRHAALSLGIAATLEAIARSAATGLPVIL